MKKMTTMRAIARRLRRARLAAGIETKEAAARAARVRSGVYWRHENGTQGIGVEFIERYAKTFDCDPCWLAFGRGECWRTKIRATKGETR